MKIARTFAILLSATWAVTGAEVPFVLDLYEKLESSEENLCLSPSSLSSTLAMALEGARGRTADQIAETLRMNPSQLESSRVAALSGNDRQLLVANALWGQLGFGFREEYVVSIRATNGPRSTRTSGSTSCSPRAISTPTRFSC